MISIKKNSMQVKLMTFFMVLTMLIFVSVGVLFYSKTSVAINEAKETELQTLAHETANKIDRFIFERYGDVQVMAESPILKKTEIDNKLKYQFIQNVRRAYNAYDYISITDLKGNIEVISGDLKGDIEYKKWLSKVAGGQLVITDFIRKEKEKVSVVYLIAPIVDENGEIKKAVVERMNLSAITEIVKNVHPGNNGYAYILQDSGNTILHPKDVAQVKLSGVDKGIRAHDVAYNGIKFVSYVYPIQQYNTQESKWYLAVEEPINEAFQVRNRLRNYTVSLIIVSLMILYILAIILSKKITKPIEKLLQDTQNIIEGNTTERIEIQSSDEIGGIAKSFNMMLYNLKAMMDQLLETSAEVASLVEVREYTDKLFSNFPNAVITIDSSGKVTSFNTAAVVITGLDSERMIGKSVKEETFSNIALLTNLLLDGVEKKAIYIKHIIKIKDINNKEFPIMVNTFIETDNNERIIGVIAVFKTVEELKSFENSVLRAKNLASLGALSAGVAHEIRNPLTSIRGYAQFVKNELGLENELNEDIDIIISEVDRLNGIIDRFLTFARPKELKLRLYNMNDIIQNVIRLLNKEIESRPIQINFQYGILPDVAMDNDQMEQVMLNVILNAIQAMPNGGRLTILTCYIDKEDIVQIEIGDTGVGIEAKDCENIFEPFFTTKEKGTGLGLAICSTIVENHKGFIEVSSMQGIGTRFIIKNSGKKRN